MTDQGNAHLSGTLIANELVTGAQGVRFQDGSRQSRATSVTSYFNVSSFGAKGDGLTDDTSAFMAAAGALNAAGGGTLFVPRGTYLIASQIVVTSSANFVGEGPQVTRLVWTATQGGLRCSFGPEGGRTRLTATVTGMTFATKTPDGGSGLTIESSVGAGNIGKSVLVSNCHFTQDVDGAYWSNGISMTNMRDTTVRDCDFRGKEGGALPSMTGITIGGDGGVTTHLVNNCTFAGTAASLHVIGEVEGVVFSECVTIGHKGVVWDTAHPRPGLFVADCHFDTVSPGIEAWNCSESVIHHNLFYPRDGASSFRASIYVDGQVTDCRIVGNKFDQHLGLNDYNAIVIGGFKSGTPRYTRIEGNTISGAVNGIWIQDAVDTYVLDNSYRFTSTPMFDQGSNTRVRNLP
ncbi:MAG: right-handed parallel beta-helix repeat-containing protein [Armatimonadetes bacterium]|nr:right-handed parallel beta-helix repeat-containing protein [Armatimonadota bacterium]